MKHLTVLSRREDADRLTEKLLWLACLEVSSSVSEDQDSGGRGADPLSAETAARRAGCEKDLAKLQSAMKLLSGYRDSGGGLFGHKKKIPRRRFFGEEAERENAAALSCAEKAAELGEELERRKNELASLGDTEKALAPWLGLESAVGTGDTKNTVTALGLFPLNLPFEQTLALLAESDAAVYAEEVSRDSRFVYSLVIWHRADADAARAALSGAGFAPVDLKTAAEGKTPAQRCAEIDGEKRALDARIDECREGLRVLSEKYADLETAFDVKSTELEKLQMFSGMGQTERTVILEGWVPVAAVPEVEKALDEMPVAYELREPEEGEDPPVQLLNGRAAQPFESVVGLYSLPAYGTFDPTAVMAVFYFIIFGLMFGDVIYGLLLTVGGFLACRFLDLGGGVKKLIKMFAICGISSMISGVLFGSWLGDLPSVFSEYMLGKGPIDTALWFNPVEDPVTFLIVALAAGAVHLLFGMGLNGYIRWRRGDKLGAVLDTGSWYLLFAGIGCVAAGVPFGKWVAIAGVAALVLTQGRAQRNPVMKLFKGVGSLYGLINYASDLLSYSRIMALGMASAVIASVINIMSTLAGPSVFGYILMLIVVPIGHLVNIAVNLLGTFVHTSRLQYIEFFGKFYEDGGREFKPAAPKIRFTKVGEAEGTGQSEKNGQ